MPEKKDFTETDRNLEVLTAVNTLVILLDLDHSILEDGDSPETVLNKVSQLNATLTELAQSSGLNLIPVILTQRPWSVFSGKNSSPKFTPLLEINQQRRTQDGKITAVSPFIVLCEFGAVALTPDRQHDWKMIKNPQLKRIGLEQNVAQLKTWLIKMNLMPEPGRNYTGPIGDQHIETTQLEPGNEFYLAIQEKSGDPMDPGKKEQLAKIFLDTLRQNQEYSILNLFNIVTSGRDLDFLPKIFQEFGKLIGANWLKELLLPQHYWFSFKNLIVVDDQSHIAGLLFQEILKQGGQAIAVANADDSLQDICRKNNGIVADQPYFDGVLAGLRQAIQRSSNKIS